MVSPNTHAQYCFTKLGFVHSIDREIHGALRYNRLQVLLGIMFTSNPFAATPIIRFKNNDYPVIDVKDDSVVIEIKGKPKVIKRYEIRIDPNSRNQSDLATVTVNSRITTAQTKGEKRIRFKADITTTADLKNCFLVLTTKEPSNTVIRKLPDLEANKKRPVFFEKTTNGFSIGETYQIYVFTEGKCVSLTDGNPYAKGQVVSFDSFPRARFQVAPIFPEELKGKINEAKVLVEFTIESDGSLSNVTALESPHELFSQAAIESLEKSLWSPRRVNGEAKSTRIKQTITFRLQEPKPRKTP